MSKEIGEFTLTHNGFTYGTNSKGEIVNSSHFVGKATCYGPVWGTLISSQPFVHNSFQTKADTNVRAGECQWTGTAFMDDGSQLGSLGSGTWKKSSDNHKWNMTLNLDLSDGGKHRLEGSTDLETLIFSGKIYQG